MKHTLGNTVQLLALSALIVAAGTTLFAQPANNQNQPADPNAAQPSDLGGWRMEDFRPYVKALDDLKKLGREYSETVLEQAIDEYSTGIDMLEDMQAEITKSEAAFARQNNLSERWYWQEIDRKNQQERIVNRIKNEAKLRAVTHFTRAINLLDSIQSNEVRTNQKFIDYEIKVFQAYVSTQYDLHNLKPCIPILERYVAINEQTKKDVSAYKYLASCYGFMEAMLLKYDQGHEDVALAYKQKKNAALLMACELEYSTDSPQYKHLKEIVELDEKKSQRINNFR